MCAQEGVVEAAWGRLPGGPLEGPPGPGEDAAEKFDERNAGAEAAVGVDQRPERRSAQAAGQRKHAVHQERHAVPGHPAADSLRRRGELCEKSWKQGEEEEEGVTAAQCEEG